jgi:hypothetical protein
MQQQIDIKDANNEAPRSDRVQIERTLDRRSTALWDTASSADLHWIYFPIIAGYDSPPRIT